jgi:hypothetical protein
MTRLMRLVVIALVGLIVGVAIASLAHARLIPPASPWPAGVLNAGNPLWGSPYTANGANASANTKVRVWLPVGRSHRTVITRTVGARTVVRGNLTNLDTHTWVTGATVILCVQSVYGGEWQSAGTAVTSSHGQFRLVLPPGYARRVGVVYWPFVNSSWPAFSRRLLVRARPRVTLSTNTRGRTIQFRGLVNGNPPPESGVPAMAQIPQNGLLVAIQVRNNQHHWVTARLTRTGPDGGFYTHYRFPASNRFRVRASVPTQGGWFLFGGHSSTRTVHPG